MPGNHDSNFPMMMNRHPMYFADCLTPIGSIEDLENSKVCYNCGSLDAINQEKLLEKKAGEIND